MKVIRGGRSAKSLVSMNPDLAESDNALGRFKVPSTNSRGFSVRIACMVSPDMKRVMSTFIASRAVPIWDTEGDLVRYCIREGLEKLMRETKTPAYVNGPFSIMTSWFEVQGELYDAKYWGDQLFPILRQELAALVRAKDFPPAYRLLKRVEDNIDKIPVKHWREKYRRELLEHYSWLRGKVQGDGRRPRT